MVAGITATYGLSFSNGFLSALVASTVGGAAATLTGRAIVGGLLKLIPGVGSVVSFRQRPLVLSPRVSGGTYITTLDALFAKYGGEPPSQDEVLAEVRKRFEQG